MMEIEDEKIKELPQKWNKKEDNLSSLFKSEKY